MGTSYVRYDEGGEFLGLADMRLEHPSFVAGTEDCWGARWGERGCELVRLDERWEVVARHPAEPEQRRQSKPGGDHESRGRSEIGAGETG